MEQNTNNPASSAEFEEILNKLSFKITIGLSLITLVLMLSFGLVSFIISDGSVNHDQSKQVSIGFGSMQNSVDPDEVELVSNYIQRVLHDSLEVYTTIPQDNGYGTYHWSSDYIDNMPLFP